MARRRSKRKAALPDRVDDAGRRVVLGMWWLIGGAVRLVLGALALIARPAWRWYRGCGLGVRLALPAVAIVAAAWGWHVHAAARRVHPMSDVEALARVIRSEVGDASYQQRVHVAWATRNLAAERHESIVELVCSPCGEQGRGRPESSRQDATDDDRDLARAVLAQPCELDPTDGATQFLDPLLQDQLARTHFPGYVGRPYSVVARQWQRYGWEPYYRLAPTLEMWGPVRHGKHRVRRCTAYRAIQPPASTRSPA